MVDELVQLVNVQGSVGSQRAWALFYVNLGVFSPAVWRLWWGREPPPLFDRTWCPWWNRLEHDVEGIVRRDLWQITEEHGPDEVGALVGRVLTERGLPQMDALSSVEQLYQHVAGLEARRAEAGVGPSPDYALLTAIRGDRVAAGDLLVRVWNRWAHLRPNVEAAGQRLGLDLELNKLHASPEQLQSRDAHRIYVDFNTMMTDEQERVWIHPTEVRAWFRPGLHVRLWAEDLSVDATLEQERGSSWFARPDWSTRQDEPTQ